MRLERTPGEGPLHRITCARTKMLGIAWREQTPELWTAACRWKSVFGVQQCHPVRQGMEMAVAVNRRHTFGETDFDLVASRKKHLSSLRSPSNARNNTGRWPKTSRKRAGSRENRLWLRERRNPRRSKPAIRSEHRKGNHRGAVRT